MTTNLLAVITFVTVTNTTTILPKIWRNTGCPDNVPGCLVAHGEFVTDAAAKTRTITTECIEEKHIAIAGQLLVQTNRILWRRTEEQRLRVIESWVTELSRLEESNKVAVVDNRQAVTNSVYLFTPITNVTTAGTFQIWDVTKTNTITFK